MMLLAPAFGYGATPPVWSTRQIAAWGEWRMVSPLDFVLWMPLAVPLRSHIPQMPHGSTAVMRWLGGPTTMVT